MTKGLQTMSSGSASSPAVPRSSSPGIHRTELGADELRVPRTDPVYNAHGYLTKVPVGAIMPYIERFTAPGELVLDPFAGSGMTGVAAYMCGRRCLLNDISELGKHVGDNFLDLVDAHQLRRVSTAVVARTLARIKPIYATSCGRCGGPATIAKAVWSYLYECPSCAGEILYYALVSKNDNDHSCPHCRKPLLRRAARRISERPVLLFVNCDRCGKNLERPATLADEDAARHVVTLEPAASWPDIQIPANREMYRRSALGKNGLTSTAAFFSPRNLRALAVLKHEIDAVEDAVEDAHLRSKLLFAFTAMLPRASKRYQWGPTRPLNAQNQTYYVAPVFYEWNVVDLFKRKIEAAIRSDEYVRSARGGELWTTNRPPVEYHVGSAADLNWIPDATVDYVFTDPPFGSNLFYSDMSLFQEAWLGRFTDPTSEAVIHTDPKRRASSELAYERTLAAALAECHRVLKPGRWATIVFSNSRGGLWSMLYRAIRSVGFALVGEETRILDKGQRSVKGLTSGREGVVTVDLVLTLKKQAPPVYRPTTSRGSTADFDETIRRVLSSFPLGTQTAPSHIYLSAIRHYLRDGLDPEQLHFDDVLGSLRRLGYEVDPNKGTLLPLQNPR